MFDKQGRACSHTLHGEISQDQVLQLFDVLVPAKCRGVKLQDMLACAGACREALVYQNVTLVSGVVGSQRSEPAAIITFGRADCRTAVAEAKKQVLKIQR